MASSSYRYWDLGPYDDSERSNDVVDRSYWKSRWRKKDRENAILFAGDVIRFDDEIRSAPPSMRIAYHTLCNARRMWSLTALATDTFFSFSLLSLYFLWFDSVDFLMVVRGVRNRGPIENRCQPRRPYHFRGAESVVHARGALHQIARHARHGALKASLANFFNFFNWEPHPFDDDDTKEKIGKKHIYIRKHIFLPSFFPHWIWSTLLIHISLFHPFLLLSPGYDPFLSIGIVHLIESSNNLGFVSIELILSRCLCSCTISNWFLCCLIPPVWLDRYIPHITSFLSFTQSTSCLYIPLFLMYAVWDHLLLFDFDAEILFLFFSGTRHHTCGCCELFIFSYSTPFFSFSLFLYPTTIIHRKIFFLFLSSTNWVGTCSASSIIRSRVRWFATQRQGSRRWNVRDRCSWRALFTAAPDLTRFIHRCSFKCSIIQSASADTLSAHWQQQQQRSLL